MLVLAGLSLQAETSFEYHVKAAFILNFAKFTEWPPDKTPLIFGVLGDNPFEDALEKLTANKKIGDRNIVVKYFSTVSEFKNKGGSQVLFIGTSDPKEMQALLALAKKFSVLSVTDPKISGENIGIISLMMENKNVRFSVNLELAKKFNIKLSSELLKLAKETS